MNTGDENGGGLQLPTIPIIVTPAEGERPFPDMMRASDVADRMFSAEQRTASFDRTTNGYDGSPVSYGPASRGAAEVEEKQPLRDSFGLYAYTRKFNTETQMDTRRVTDIVVPWRLRHPRERDQCNFFTFLVSRQFWWQIEFAIRVTAFAVLLPAALIASNVQHNPFVSTTYVLSSMVLASKMTVGESFAYVVTWTRAGILWLPFATIGASIHLDKSMAGWCVYYVAMLFIMAVLTENMVRRICLLLFNICMVGILTGNSHYKAYPSRVMVDWCIGMGLCMIAIFLPYPVFSNREAYRFSKDIATSIGTAFHGISCSFWADSYVERNLAIAKVRLMMGSLDSLFPRFETAQAGSFYEFFFEKAEVREIRALKVKLFGKLRVNLSSMMRVLDMVEAKPWAIDKSERSQAFAEILVPHIANLAHSVDELLDRLSHAKTLENVHELQPTFRLVRDRVATLEREYNRARMSLFYANLSDTLEEFVPLMTFFIFSIVNFHETIETFKFEGVVAKTTVASHLYTIIDHSLLTPVKENWEFFRVLCSEWRRRDIQRLIEAAKVSVAMILTIGFSYLIDIPKKSLSGPNIIAFVSGNNPVEAVQASVVRLTGCLLGTVLGFFAGSYSTTSIDKVASLCVLMFVFTFMRNDREYGVMSVYAMFVLIPLDTVTPTTTSDTIARMNQNTFGIFIYCFISIVVFPLSPSRILLKKRANILLRMSASFHKMMELFADPTTAYTKRVSTLLHIKLRTGEIDPDLDDVEMKGVGTSQNSSSPEYAKESDSVTSGKHVQIAHPIGESGDGNAEDVRFEFSDRVGPSGCGLTNGSIVRSMKLDTTMQDINAMIADVEVHIKRSTPFIGFAREERGLVDTYYPAKSCEAIHLRLHRMLVLLHTIWYSWSVMRTQYIVSRETRHMMENLSPIACDLSRAFSRFVTLVVHSLMDPSVVLERELLEAAQMVTDAAEELHKRKSMIIILTMYKAVAEYRSDKRAREAAAAALARSHQPDADSRVSSPTTLRRRSGLTRQSTGHPLPSFDETIMSHSQLRRSEVPNSVPGGNNYQAPGRQTSGFKVYQSDQNVTINPVGEPLLDSIPLDSDFRVPLTNEDAKCLHSLSLCCKMFADECKQLLVALEETLVWLRRKSRG